MIWEDTGLRVSSKREMNYHEIQILTPCDPDEFSYQLDGIRNVERDERARAFCMNFIEQQFEPALFDACNSRKSMRSRRGLFLIAGIAGRFITPILLGVDVADFIYEQAKKWTESEKQQKFKQVLHQKLIETYKQISSLSDTIVELSLKHEEMEKFLHATIWSTSAFISNVMEVRSKLKNWHLNRKDQPLPKEILQLFQALPACYPYCNLETIGDVECYFSKNSTSYNLVLKYSIEAFNPWMRIVKADPFKIFRLQGEHVCTRKFIGKPYQIFDSRYGLCHHHADTALDNPQVLIEPSKEDCVSNNGKVMRKEQWSEETCVPMDQHDSFAPQVKKSEGFYHIFCNGKYISFGKVTRKCPEYVFKFPFGMNFSIEGAKFTWEGMRSVDIDSQIRVFIDGPEPSCSKSWELREFGKN